MMVYRIRYNTRGGSIGGEAVVEANSPTEAMVKFRHASDCGPRDRSQDEVTSVRADENFADIGPY